MYPLVAGVISVNSFVVWGKKIPRYDKMWMMEYDNGR